MTIKKICFTILSGLLLLTSLPVSIVSAAEDTSKQSTKDEVIYGNLDANGQTKDMYVVNSFHVNKPGEIIDYGNYIDVQNLTDLSEIIQNNEKVEFETEEKEFYYQGELNSQPLPWNISITYLLDNKKVSADELVGQGGDLEIQITTEANKQVDKVFFENYLLQIALTLDPQVFTDIQAPEGTEANEGKNKQVAFMVLPDKEEELILTAKVTDLEMDPIDITAIPANIAIDSPDLTTVKGDMKSLSDGIREVNSGVKELTNGISELNSGAKQLGNGSTDYRNGINELSQSSDELVNGSSEIKGALNTISESLNGDLGMPDLSELKALPSGLRDMAAGLREAADGISTLKKNYNAAHDTLDKAIKGIPDYEISEKQIQSLYESGADADVINKLVETYQAAVTVKETYRAVQEGFDAVSSTLDQVSGPINQVANQLDAVASEAEKGMKNMDQLDDLAELQTGLSSLTTEYQSFHKGLVEYTNGVGKLASSYNELDTGIQGLSNGASSLLDGANELQNGTEELQDETSDLPGQLESEVEEMLKEFENEDFEPTSFVSEQNENIDVVQFVLKTEAIEIDEPETEDSQVEEEKGLWERFLDLFR